MVDTVLVAIPAVAGEPQTGWVAALSYARSVKIHHEQQARLVYSKVSEISEYSPGAMLDLLPNGARIGCGAEGASLILPAAPDQQAQWLVLAPVIQLTVVIHNGSKELIGPAKVQIFNNGLKKIHDTRSVIVGAVEPESDYIVTFTIENAHHPGSPSLGTTLIFRDASGQWWRRQLGQGVLQRDPRQVQQVPDDLHHAGLVDDLHRQLVGMCT